MYTMIEQKVKQNAINARRAKSYAATASHDVTVHFRLVAAIINMSDLVDHGDKRPTATQSSSLFPAIGNPKTKGI